jgi:hypothetical protein
LGIKKAAPGGGAAKGKLFIKIDSGKVQLRLFI